MAEYPNNHGKIEDGDFEIVQKEELEIHVAIARLSNSLMMRDLYNALPLPDDKPITAICLVEDIFGCPPNYKIVSKTHDQDIDADLCKDGFFKRVTRYLCYSKTEGFYGYVIENLLILNDKESRPPGYTIIEQTTDTGQKTFRKKQLCYKAVPRNIAGQVITDIIILSRSKVAPEGFTLVGEMNGLSVCYKQSSTGQHGANAGPLSNSNVLPYGVNPSGSRGSISSTGSGGMYPGLQDTSSFYPSRPAPQPPESSVPGAFPYLSPQHHAKSTADSSDMYGAAQSALFRVPFVVNKKYLLTDNSNDTEGQLAPTKSYQQVTDEYYYSFSLEQDILLRPSA